MSYLQSFNNDVGLSFKISRLLSLGYVISDDPNLTTLLLMTAFPVLTIFEIMESYDVPYDGLPAMTSHSEYEVTFSKEL
jgi:hypothetical protein